MASLFSRCHSCRVGPAAGCNNRAGPRRVVLASASRDDDAPSMMSQEDAYKVLGLPSGASFEQVVRAKNSALQSASQDRALEVESAYDTLFMHSMKKRLSGELEVSTSVRYADVPASPPKKAVQRSLGSGPSSPVQLPKSLGSGAGALNMGLQLERSPNRDLAVQQAAVFGVLAVAAAAQAMLESPDMQLSETAGLQLALAMGYTVYTLKERKRMGLGKAMGVTMAALVAGALVGSAIQAYLRVDIVPLGAFGSPGVLVTEVAILLLGLASVFLA